MILQAFISLRTPYEPIYPEASGFAKHFMSGKYIVNWTATSKSNMIDITKINFTRRFQFKQKKFLPKNQWLFQIVYEIIQYSRPCQRYIKKNHQGNTQRAIIIRKRKLKPYNDYLCELTASSVPPSPNQLKKHNNNNAKK